MTKGAGGGVGGGSFRYYGGVGINSRLGEFSLVWAATVRLTAAENLVRLTVRD